MSYKKNIALMPYNSPRDFFELQLLIEPWSHSVTSQPLTPSMNTPLSQCQAAGDSGSLGREAGMAGKRGREGEADRQADRQRGKQAIKIAHAQGNHRSHRVIFDPPHSRRWEQYQQNSLVE